MSLKKTVIAISTILLFAIAFFIYSSMDQSVRVVNKGNKTIASVVPYGGPPPSSPLA
jgi:hypothetical protein